MATYARKLKDSSGNYVCPVTRAEQVYFSDNSKLSKLTPYPVGSWYFTSGYDSPASLFGGSWTQMKDRFLVGAGNSYGREQTGGASTIALTEANIPKHTHIIPALSGTAASSGSHTHPISRNGQLFAWPGGSQTGIYTAKSFQGWNQGTVYAGDVSLTTSSSGSHTHSVSTNQSKTWETGGNGAHENRPPYMAIYMWKRVS